MADRLDTEDPRDLVMRRVIAAPRERVFAIWTDPTRLTDWWGPHGMTVPEWEMDLRPGGAFRTLMRDGQGNEYPFGGVFLEVVAPERIVFTDAYGPGWMPSAKPFTTAVITLVDLGEGRTEYVGRARHWTEADRDHHAAMGFHDGWGQSVDRLKALAEADRAPLP